MLVLFPFIAVSNLACLNMHISACSIPERMPHGQRDALHKYNFSQCCETISNFDVHFSAPLQVVLKTVSSKSRRIIPPALTATVYKLVSVETNLPKQNLTLVSRRANLFENVPTFRLQENRHTNTVIQKNWD